jgi:hypothetical protein
MSDAHGNCGEKEMCAGFQWGKLREKVPLEDPDLDGWIRLKRIVKNEKTICGFVSSGSGQVQKVLCCEDSNELSQTIKCDQFLH